MPISIRIATGIPPDKEFKQESTCTIVSLRFSMQANIFENMKATISVTVLYACFPDIEYEIQADRRIFMQYYFFRRESCV